MWCKFLIQVFRNSSSLNAFTPAVELSSFLWSHTSQSLVSGTHMGNEMFTIVIRFVVIVLLERYLSCAFIGCELYNVVVGSCYVEKQWKSAVLLWLFLFWLECNIQQWSDPTGSLYWNNPVAVLHCWSRPWIVHVVLCCPLRSFADQITVHFWYKILNILHWWIVKLVKLISSLHLMAIFRWICGVKTAWKKEKQRTQRLLGLESVRLMIKKSRLRWIGHVERKDNSDWVKHCITWEVRIRHRGWPEKTWWDCVNDDVESWGLSLKDMQFRNESRRRIKGATG